MEIIDKTQLVRYNNSLIVKSLQDAYSSKSFFDILEITRSELGHSHVIKWLFLLDNLSCGWKDYPILSFLDLVLKNAEEQNKAIDETFADKILLRDAIVLVENIELEKTTNGVTATNNKGEQSKGRIDILIECNIKYTDDNNEINRKLKICIENKVDSSEHDWQTWKYYAYLAGKDAIKEEFTEKVVNNIITFSQGGDDDTKISYNKNYDYNKKEDEIQLFVFLTPKKDEEISCHHFVVVTYQDLMDGVLVKLSKQNNLLPKDKLFLDEYMSALSIPFMDEKKQKEMPILAIREEDVDRLDKFFEENTELIKSVIKEIYKIEGDKDKKCETFWKNNGRFIKNALNAYVIVEKRRNTNPNGLSTKPTLAEILLGITKRNKKYPSWIWIKRGGNYNKYETLIDAVKEIVSFLLERSGGIDNVNEYLSSKKVVVPYQLVLRKDEPKKLGGKDRYTSFVGDKGNTYYVSTQWSAKTPEDNFFMLVNATNAIDDANFHIWTDIKALDILHTP